MATFAEPGPTSGQSTEISGVLIPFFETGTEGILWALEEHPPKGGYEGLHILKDGDYLTVFGDSGEIIWEGTIKLEYKTGYRPYPLNPKYGQQAVFGCWIHGNQEGMDLEEWASMFFAGEMRSCRYATKLKAILRPAPREAPRSR